MARAALSPAAVCGSQQASPSSLVLFRGQQSSAAVSPRGERDAVVADKARSRGGRLNNAAEFAVTKLDDLVNWGRKVR